MRDIIIEVEVQRQLYELKDYLIEKQGKKKGLNTIADILSSIDNLAIFDSIGSNIKERFEIDCPDNWYLLYVKQNYFVYSKTDNLITVLKMYNNKQDFIYKLFGIEMRSQDSKDYWGE